MRIILVGSLVKRRYLEETLKQEGTGEVWGLNAIYPKWIDERQWSRRFNLHTYENLQRYKWKPEYFQREVDFSRNRPEVPFYTIDEWPEPHDLAGWKRWPVEAMDDTFPRRSRYHCGSFDWMVAFAVYLNSGHGSGGHAISEPVHEIVLHGTALTMEAGEPISARACLEYWCGVAEGHGIKVTVAEDGALFDFYHLVRSDLCYGLDDTPVVEDKRSYSPNKGKAPYDYED